MLKALFRPAMIVVPLVIGFFVPAAGNLAYEPYYVVRYNLVLMIFLAALGIKLQDLKLRREHGLLLAANILLGVVPFMVLRKIFPADPALAQMVFFIGITPTAAASSVIISLLNGRVGFSLTGFAVSNIGIALAMLGLLPYTTGNFSAEFCTSVAQTIVLIIMLPVAMAQVCRRIFPAAVKLIPKFKMVSLSLWSLSLFILAGVARQYFIAHPGESVRQAVLCGAVSLVCCAVNFACGAWIARKKFRRECSQLLGQKNTIFTVCLALAYADALAALGVTFYIVWHNSWNAAQLLMYDRRQKKRLSRQR